LSVSKVIGIVDLFAPDLSSSIHVGTSRNKGDTSRKIVFIVGSERPLSSGLEPTLTLPRRRWKWCRL